MAEQSLNETKGIGNLKQADSILQETSGKLELAIEAMRNGVLTENTQYGLESILRDMKADIERAGAILSTCSHQENVPTSYIALIHKDKGSTFGVSFPDFPGCITAVSTLDEASNAATEALSRHIETMCEFGKEVPASSLLSKLAFTGAVSVLIVSPHV